MKTIDAEELKQIMNQEDDWVVLDVLPSDKYREEHIPGAINVPLKEDGSFVERVNETVDDPSQKIIVYCADPDCELSPEAARRLEREGFPEVLDFEGGIEEWKQAGYEVTSE